MAEALKWSKEFPTKVGYYWYRYRPREDSFMIEISGGGVPGGVPVPVAIYGAKGEDDQVHLCDWSQTREEFEKVWGKRGEFWGPIERPEN